MTNGNGIKLGKVQSWWITLGIALVGLIGTTFVQHHRLTLLEGEVQQFVISVDNDLKDIHRDVDHHELNIEALNLHLEYMKKTLDEIKNLLKNMLQR